MKYFPVFFNLGGQRVLVVGGGEVALRKIALLERTGARITVVAPEILPELLARGVSAKSDKKTAAAHIVAPSGEPSSIEFRRREFEPADLDGARLVIVATSRRAVNRWIATLAEARSIPVNVVDDREASRFIVPAIVDRDPVLVAISTAGASPVLARRLREQLEAFIPTRFGKLAVWLRELRKTALERLRDTAERRRFFETLVDGPAARRFIEGDRRGAERIAQQLLAGTAQAPSAKGEVTLVGAGPGDPDLLTIKALRALQDADVILYDRLVSPAILDLARRDAIRICVGKSPQSSAMHRRARQAQTSGALISAEQTPGPQDVSTSQADINAALIEHANAGRRVVRLKGGDPFIFGRGGEELQALAQAGIAFSVIPGITAAAGCTAYAGIPLTHRDFAQTVTFVTGHDAGVDPRETLAAPDHFQLDASLASAHKQPDLTSTHRQPDWLALAQPNQTVVFYMGLSRVENIVDALMKNGAPASRAVAVIAQGTTADQRVVTATLGTLVTAVASAALPTPALLVVGEVVSLHQTLSWFAPLATQDVSQIA